MDIPPYVYLEGGMFTTPINDYTEGSNLERDKDGDFWRPGPMAEGFEFYEVLPKFIDKAKDYLNNGGKLEAIKTKYTLTSKQEEQLAAL